MKSERVCGRRYCQGSGNYLSPCRALPEVSIEDFAGQVWHEHKARVLEGQSVYLNFENQGFAIRGNPRAKELPQQISIRFIRGPNKLNFEATFELGMKLYTEFLILRLKEPSQA